MVHWQASFAVNHGTLHSAKPTVMYMHRQLPGSTPLDPVMSRAQLICGVDDRFMQYVCQAYRSAYQHSGFACNTAHWQPQTLLSNMEYNNQTKPTKATVMYMWIHRQLPASTPLDPVILQNQALLRSFKEAAQEPLMDDYSPGKRSNQ